MSASKTYQMFWDCEFCGTTRLLGLTHRFCPNCGSAQNPDKRYYPSDEEKIAVEDHIYHGEDRLCPSCNTATSAAAEFCMQCGTPLSDAAKASVRAAETRGGEGFKQGAARDLVKEKFDAQANNLMASSARKRWKPGRFSWAAIIATVLSLTGGGVYGLFFWEREASVVVAGHEWERTIDLERFQEVRDGDWCDSMPGDAYDVSRSQKQRSTRRVQDGETCTTRRVDQGDGTFREENVCSPKYREEPVLDTYCDYSVNRWQVVDTERSAGGLSDQPIWPALNLSRPGDCLGCEREGDHHETYTVIFRENGKNETYKCTFSMERWRSFAVESRWILQVGQVAGNPDCSSLKPAS